ncbi:MAG TPA: endo-1,4-beta-xylanase [Gemmatimonadaceae bacterium]|jgi:endo-1,4-beta-xylanase|nr:endo-1,4-beta-xylanase [Gemmatimonadaceae bacterium]
MTRLMNDSLRGLPTSTLIAAVVAAGCSTARPSPDPAPGGASVSVPAAGRTLKDAYAGKFMVGAALNEAQYTEKDARGAALVKAQFNTITSENILKWENVHPRLGEYDFSSADRYVAFGERNGMFIVGHTLLWHQQTPRWVFQDAQGSRVSRDTLLARLRDHIHTVVGRYKGRIKGWDVVNEAIDEDGTLRRTPWLEIIGPDYIEKAFQWAHEADPSAELYYNDYSVENAPKRNGVVRLVRDLQAKGVRITGVGLQGHNRVEWPSVAQQDSTIAAFGELGMKVMITELDIDVLPRVTRGPTADVSARAEARAGLDPYKAGLPDSVQQTLAKRYGELFAVYLKHRNTISRVTFWGVADGDSWLNNWPVQGRTSYPLLFDRAGLPKPAFDAVIRAATQPAFVP